MASRDTGRVSSEKPVIIYDGNCDFCRRRVARWQDVAGNRLDFVPSEDARRLSPAVTQLALNESVHLIEPSGRISQGAQAIFRMRKIALGRSLPLWLYDNVPGFRYVAEQLYRLVARHRKHLGSRQAGKA